MLLQGRDLLLPQRQFRGANPLWSSYPAWTRDVLLGDDCTTCNSQCISDRGFLFLEPHHAYKVDLFLLKCLPAHILQLSYSDPALLRVLDQIVGVWQVPPK